MHWSYRSNSFDLSLEKGETCTSMVVTKCFGFFILKKINVGQFPTE